MSVESEISWFLSEFGDRVAEAVEDTPLSVPLLAGIGYQETGYIWSAIRKVTDSEEEFLLYCVGDTIDAYSSTPRRAFPKNKTELVNHPRGEEMFEIARESLARIASAVSGYRSAARTKTKYCRGYGLFQYDLQYFKKDPDYFLSEGWKDFDACLGKALDELLEAAERLGLHDTQHLSASDAAKIAIMYNTGRYRPQRGLKQGHKSGGRYYGENVYDYIRLAQRLHDPVERHDNQDASEGEHFRVIARSGLILRSAPALTATRLDVLPLGEEVEVLGFYGDDGDWALVDLEGDGAADGYVFAGYLTQV